jgi:hypothetical protein
MGDSVFHRFLLWLSAGVVTAGVSMAMVAGAGFAVADDGSPSGAGGGPSSQSSNSSGKKPNSDKDEPKPDPKKDDKKDTPASGEQSADADTKDTEGASETGIKDQGTTDELPKDSTDEVTPPVKDTSSAETPKKGNDHEAAEPTEHETADRLDKPATPAAEPEVKKAEANDAKDADVPDQAEESAAGDVDAAGPVDEAVAAVKMKQTEATTAFAFAAAEPAAAPTGPTLINVVGSFFWGLFDLFTKVITGPPVVPPGSTVTAGRSKLQIDCGDGYTADADWYFPAKANPTSSSISSMDSPATPPSTT